MMGSCPGGELSLRGAVLVGSCPEIKPFKCGLSVG